MGLHPTEKPRQDRSPGGAFRCRPSRNVSFTKKPAASEWAALTGLLLAEKPTEPRLPSPCQAARGFSFGPCGTGFLNGVYCDWNFNIATGWHQYRNDPS